MTQIPLDTLKQCLQFLEWLHRGSPGRGGMRYRVASQLAEHKSKYYNQVMVTGDLPHVVSGFLTKVSKFHTKLCKSPQPSKHEASNPADVLNALFACIPKILAAMYFLWYNVDEKFGAVGGGGWKDNNPGVDGWRYVWRWFKSRDWGGAIQRYLRAMPDDKEFGLSTGVIPGGFDAKDLKEGWDYNHHEGYYYAKSMIDDIKAILDKQGHNDLRDIFFTTVISDAGKNKENVANGLRLVKTFCQIVADAEQKKSSLQLKANLEENLQKCIDWDKLKSHCSSLNSQLKDFFNADAFSYTGQEPFIESNIRKEFTTEIAKWLRGGFSDALKNVNNISSGYPDVHRSNFSKVTKFATNHIFPYGFIFGGKSYGTFRKIWNTLPQRWTRVIGMLKNSGDLKTLTTLLQGTLCPPSYQPPESRTSKDAASPPKKPEVPPAKVPEVPKEVVPEKKVPVAPPAKVPEAPKEVVPVKKAEGTANQGKKAEGAQNQGKKAEGTANQGKKAEGVQNQGKKAGPGPNRTDIQSESKPGSEKDVNISDSQDEGAKQATVSAVPPPPAPPSNVTAPRGSAGTPDGEAPGSSGGDNSIPQPGGFKVTPTPQSPSVTGSGSDRSGVSRTGSDQKNGDQASDSAPKQTKQDSVPSECTEPVTISDTGSGTRAGGIAGREGGSSTGGDSRDSTTTSPECIAPLGIEILPIQTFQRQTPSLYDAGEERIDASLDGWEPTEQQYAPYVDPKTHVLVPMQENISEPFRIDIDGSPVDEIPIAEFPSDAYLDTFITPEQAGKRFVDASPIPEIPFLYVEPPPLMRLEIAHPDRPPLKMAPPDLLIEAAERPPAALLSVNDFDSEAPYSKTYDILRDVSQELGHTNGEDKGFSGVPRTNFHLDFVQGLPGLEGYEDPGMPRDSPRQVAEHNVPLIPDPNIVQHILQNTAPQMDIEVAKKGLPNSKIKPVDMSFGFHKNDALSSPTFTPIPPNISLQITTPPKDRTEIATQDPYVVASESLLIDLPNRTVQDSLHDVDMYYDHYAKADGILRNEIKNADSWYGEDTGFSGLPKSNFNLDFTPAFFEYGGHQDPGIPRDPSRQVSARDLPLFPDPTQCLNPWYVGPSSKSSTFSPAPNSDHLPPPQTIRGMLFWIVGLTEYGYIETITEHVVCILEDINNASSVYQFPDSLDIAALTTSLVTKTLTDSCHFAANFLYRFKHKDVSDAFKSFFKNQDNNGFYYSADPACLLCQLRDYVYAAHHQLEFLKSQCSRNELHGGWQDCKYGSDITSPNSPLQAFLTDGCYSDFDTYLFDPGNICLKSRVKMGFKHKDFPKPSQTGDTLFTILSPSCGDDDPLLTLSSYLNCLTRRTPRTTGELVSFFHHFGNELHLSYSKGPSNLGTALSTPHDCCPNWDHLGRPDLDAVRDFRGCQSPSSGNCHPNTLFTLLGCHIGNVHCHRHLSPITYRAYALYSPIFSHTYLSWTVYLTDRLWESLDRLLYDLDRLQCSNVRANHHCADALPLLYYHGFTPPEGMPASAVKCSDVIAKLEEVVNGDAVAKLVTCMDAFLYRIRMPFIILGFALWSTAFCLLVHAILYRRDMLRIRSQIMRCKVSHAIDVKVLLSLSRNMISLYDIEYFDNDDELTEASNTLFQ